AYLSTIHRLSQSEMLLIVSEAAAAGQIFGVQLPPTDEDNEPWTALPSRRNKEPPIEGPLPKSVEVVLGNQIYIDRSQLPPGLVNRIARLA
ncbi:MAG: restriction endonuclease subunit R, partial [Stellaceae bacterium]